MKTKLILFPSCARLPEEAISHYINFRDSINRPMYMGEFGHNTLEWQSDFVNVLWGWLWESK